MPTNREVGASAGPSDESAWNEQMDFALTPKALLLFCNVSMPRIDSEFIPESQYTFPFGRIKPRGLLAELAKASSARQY